MSRRLLMVLCLIPGVACAQQATALALANGAEPEPGIHASGRLAPEDVARLQVAGIRHVIDLTVEGEAPGFDEAAALREAGIAYDRLPIAGADALTRENVEAFDALVGEARRPLLVHCASGNRVGAMAALRAAWSEGKPVEEAVAEGRAWGLRSLEAEVRKRLAEPDR